MSLPVKESHVLRQVLHYLALRGYWHWRNNTGAMPIDAPGGRRYVRFGSPGMPDICVRIRDGNGKWRDGETIWIECKSPKGRQNEDQKAWEGLALRHGDRYIVARSLDDVIGVGL